MPVLPGPCNGSEILFYYDRHSDACHEFEYRGCQGNKNRFQDLRSCEYKCRQRSRDPDEDRQRPVDPDQQRPEPPESIENEISDNPSCNEPVDAGPCNGEHTAYFYDKENGRCQAFLYGGCEGNANRYKTEEQCERLCGRFKGEGKQTKKNTKKICLFYYFVSISKLFQAIQKYLTLKVQKNIGYEIRFGFKMFFKGFVLNTS